METLNWNKVESSSLLFEKTVPIKITSPGCEERHVDLSVRISIGLTKHTRFFKVLQVHITNELDPYFLYSVEVNEDDFQRLKVEQCILVDFATFPYKFIELLEHCIEAASHTNPRFQAVLRTQADECTFSILEINQFKHLSHLCIGFRVGTDSTIKSYLAGRLMEFKTANTTLHEKLQRTLLSLEKAVKDNSNLSSEIVELMDKTSQDISELKTDHALEIAHTKEKGMQDCSELKQRFEMERDEVECRFKHQNVVQQERITELDSQVRTLLDSKFSLEMNLSELKIKFTAMEKELNDRNQECERLQKESNDLGNKKQESEKVSNRLLIRLSALEQEVQDKNDLISNFTNQLENHASQRTRFEESLKEAQTAAEHAESKAASCAAEVKRCNQTIEKLQAEVRTCKVKIKMKAQAAVQQDSLIHERQEALDKALLESHAFKQEARELKAENESLQKKVKESQIKLDELGKVQKSNQQMIQWLNKQLTEAQLGRSRCMFGSALSFSSDSDASKNVAASFSKASQLISSSLAGIQSSAGLTGNISSNSSRTQLTPSKYSEICASESPCSTLTSRSSRTQGFPKTSGSNRSSTTVKVQYRPPSLSNTSPEGNTPEKISPTNGRSSSSMMQEGQSGKLDDVSKTILPRPQLSFAGISSKFISTSAY